MRDELILKMLPLVEWFVDKRLTWVAISRAGGRQDARQIATIAMIEAVDAWLRSDRKLKVSGWVVRHIRWAFCVTKKLGELIYLPTIHHRRRMIGPIPRRKKQAREFAYSVEWSDFVDLAAIIGDALRQLDMRQAEVIRRRHGLCGYEAHTLQEVGDAIGLSKERVRHLVAKGEQKMKQYLSKLTNLP